MSDNDLIRRGDVQRAVNLALCKAPLKTTLGLIDALNDTKDAIAALPPAKQDDLASGKAVTVGVKPLRELLEAWLELATHCSIEEGVCCCGDNMEGHANPMNCGHFPVDHGSYIADHLVKRTLAALDLKGN